MKKMVVRLFAVVFFAVMVMSSFTACTARDLTLKIYNWGEYMDPGVIDQFKDWYASEHDGAEIKVVYKEFGSNEEMMLKVFDKKGDWDLACPSDYMIDRLINGKDGCQLAEISADVDRSVLNEDLIDMTTYDPGAKYSIPYAWGTFGILYDTKAIKGAVAEKMNSWAALWENAPTRVFMKKQVRDSYTAAMLYHYRNDLKAAAGYTEENPVWDYTKPAYKQLMTDIFTKFNDVEMKKGETELLKQDVYKYEEDNGKIEMSNNESEAKLGLFWSCDAGFVMNDYESEAKGCAKAVTTDGNKTLKYVVPEEGSNVWIDGWVIPKHAKNKKLAEMFINFLLTEPINKLNAVYAGAPGANAEAMDALKSEILQDDEYFAGTESWFQDMYIEMMFPTETTLNRCYVMGDFKDMYDKMTQMFDDVQEKNSLK